MTTANAIQQAPAASAERLEQRPLVAPPVDIYESAQEVLLVADLPGVGSDDLTIRVDGDQLALHARRRRPAPGAPLALERRDFDYGRTFALPRGIDTGAITADLREGVLRLHLPKAEAVKPRRIEVKAG